MPGDEDNTIRAKMIILDLLPPPVHETISFLQIPSAIRFARLLNDFGTSFPTHLLHYETNHEFRSPLLLHRLDPVMDSLNYSTNWPNY